MKERPILFSAPMVRALLAGTKTQTRRIAKPVRHPDWGNLYSPGALVREHEPVHVIYRACPYGQPGDRLWVRETFRRDLDRMNRCKVVEYRADDAVLLASPGPGGAFDFPDLGWRPSIHMPRWASRITLEITGVRVERLQNISEDDAKAEGAWGPDDSIVNQVAAHFKCEPTGTHPSLAYRMVWEQINGAGSWEANPWVWAVEFKRVEGQKK